jgi:hypothetical protein
VRTDQEWQSSNLGRFFPFSEKISQANAAFVIPTDFFLDLTFFSDYYYNNDIYISSINYSTSSDEYAITINYISDNSVAISQAVPRTISGVSRVGKRTSIRASHGTPDIVGNNNNYSVCCFTPGPAWDRIINEPSTLSNILNLNKTESAIEESICTPSANTLKRIFIEPSLANVKTNTVYVKPLPNKDLWGREFHQRIIQGSNIIITQDAEDKNSLIISALPNKNPANALEEHGIKFINDIGPVSEKGQFFINTKDCLKKIEKPFDTATLTKIENHIQLLSDCLPCCGCEKYRAVSEAITRRSKKLQEICDLLSSMITANTQLYNDAVIKINSSRIPITRIRNLRVYEDRFKISVQNACVFPIYAQIGISIIGGTGIEPNNFGIVEENSCYYSGIPPLLPSSFPSLTGTSKDYLNVLPDVAAGDYRGFVSSSDSTSSNIIPISPGSYTDLTFYVKNSALLVPGFDLRDNGLKIICESNGVYGGQYDSSGTSWIGTYGCKKDKWCARCDIGVPIITNSCGVTRTRDTWNIVEFDCQ